MASWVGLHNRPVLILRYEDLCANPARQLTRIAEFLGVTLTEIQRDAAVAKSSFAELRRQELENGFNERPPTARAFFREGRAEQWRKVLSREQIATIVRAHEPMLQRFGYAPPRAGARVRLQPA